MITRTMKRSSSGSGKALVPMNEPGFCVPTTNSHGSLRRRFAAGTSRLLSVTCPSAIASSSTERVREGIRLISSTW